MRRELDRRPEAARVAARIGDAAAERPPRDQRVRPLAEGERKLVSQAGAERPRRPERAAGRALGDPDARDLPEGHDRVAVGGDGEPQAAGELGGEPLPGVERRARRRDRHVGDAVQVAQRAGGVRPRDDRGPVARHARAEPARERRHVGDRERLRSAERAAGGASRNADPHASVAAAEVLLGPDRDRVAALRDGGGEVADHGPSGNRQPCRRAQAPPGSRSETLSPPSTGTATTPAPLGCVAATGQSRAAPRVTVTPGAGPDGVARSRRAPSGAQATSSPRVPVARRHATPPVTVWKGGSPNRAADAGAATSRAAASAIRSGRISEPSPRTGR